MKPLKMIQVGSGGWGKSWLKFLHDSPDWKLAALVSRGGENLEQARSQWNLSDDVCFSDLDAALATPADAVLVTVPHHLHVPVARKALEAGKHVLCEKPFSDDFDAAVDLVSFAESTQLQLAVSQNFRYRLGLWQLKALSESLGSVDSLRIELYQPQGRLPGWRADQVSTLALEIMIHHVDMARFLLGANAEQVFCKAWNPSWSESKGPANATAIIEFNTGAVLSYVGSWATRGKRSGWEGQWRVQFENGAATWNGDAPETENADGEILSPPVVNAFPGQDRNGLLIDFAKSIRQESPFPTHGKDNLQSLAIIFAAITSFRENRPVSIQELLPE